VAALAQTVMVVLVGSCEETEPRLSAHLEGELRGLSRWRVRIHLWRCDRCQAVLASLVRTVEQIREAARPAFTPVAGPSVADEVIDRIRRDREATGA
jgi:anti-sigma factor RsiW